MIFELIFNVLFGLPNLLLSFFPSYDYQNLNQLAGIFSDFIATGLFFCGVLPFTLIITNVVLWSGGGLMFDIIEWIYDKIPFKAT